VVADVHECGMHCCDLRDVGSVENDLTAVRHYRLHLVARPKTRVPGRYQREYPRYRLREVDDVRACGNIGRGGPGGDGSAAAGSCTPWISRPPTEAIHSATAVANLEVSSPVARHASMMGRNRWGSWPQPRNRLPFGSPPQRVHSIQQT